MSHPNPSKDYSDELVGEFPNPDIETCKHGKRYHFPSGQAIDDCAECEKDNG